jgi:hypothetical protein
MSRALTDFESGIKDAEELLTHFDSLNQRALSSNVEVLKRAALVMAFTAWETYVEDRLVEEVKAKLGFVAGSALGNFVLNKLERDLKTFHNPDSEKTKRIFMDYLGLDVTEGWHWQHYDPKRAATSLNGGIAKRGEAVHRSRPANNGVPQAHLIKRDELEKTIRFIRDLVKATDVFLAETRS